MNNFAVDRERWNRLSIFEQMGNIYSEVGRSLSARTRGDEQSMEAAIVRALDLFDATVNALVIRKSPRAREVLRAKDQYLQLFYGKVQEHDAESLEKYFLAFALAARLHK